MRTENAAQLFDLVTELHRKGDDVEALKVLDTLIAAYPDMAALHVQRGLLLYALKEFRGALCEFDRALGLDPQNVQGCFGRGTVLQAEGELQSALDSYNRALGIQPDHVLALHNRALVLQELGRISEAVRSYDTAIDLIPHSPECRYGKAMCLLLLGEYQQGWPLYEWRKATIDSVGGTPQTGSPWRGEPLNGKTLLIQAEQGFGDTIQFCRFGAAAHGLGAKVVLQVQDRLTSLLETLPFPVTVIGGSSAVAACDYHEMLLSMPRHFGGEVLAAAVPYLSADPVRVEHWQRKIGADGFKIGISWQGERTREGQEKPEDRTRSFAAALFENISRISGVRLISLQKNEGIEQLAELPGGMVVETLGDAFDTGPQSFLDTAAVMESLDLVISSDTAVAHLAGALGRRFWVALKFSPDWRWLLDREDSPWYPSARLFRQRKPGDWDDVFGRMEAEIRHHVARRREGTVG